MFTQTRKYTKAVLNGVDEGLFNKDMLINEILMWMSEDDVRGMVKHYGYYLPDLIEETEEEEVD